MTDTEQQVFAICRAAMSPAIVSANVNRDNQRISKLNKLRKRVKQPLIQFINKQEVMETYGQFDAEIVLKWAALKQIDAVEYAKEWVMLPDDKKMAIYTIVSADEVKIYR